MLYKINKINMENFNIKKYLAEGKLLKEEDSNGTSSIGKNYPKEITGEYEGELQKIYGSDIIDNLRDILNTSSNEDDFINKVTYSLTDETNDLPEESKIKLRNWYQLNK
jgi:hypothetical protein